MLRAILMGGALALAPTAITAPAAVAQDSSVITAGINQVSGAAQVVQQLLENGDVETGPGTPLNQAARALAGEAVRLSITARQNGRADVAVAAQQIGAYAASIPAKIAVGGQSPSALSAELGDQIDTLEGLVS